MATHLPIYDLTRVHAQYKDAAKERSALLALGRAALVAERWDDLYRMSKELIRAATQATPGADLTSEERQIFFQATKQILSANRAAWRNCKLEEGTKDVTDEYKQHLERELFALATELVKLLEDTLITSVKSPEPQIFYRKLVGDFYRYLAEVSVPNAAVLPYSGAVISSVTAGNSVSAVVPAGYDKKSAEAYQVAMRLATTHLEATHPTRLGLCLNYSVLLYEVLKDKKQACELARSAFDQAISKLDDLDESSYKDTTLLMQLLRDNLTRTYTPRRTCAPCPLVPAAHPCVSLMPLMCLLVCLLPDPTVWFARNPHPEAK